MRAEVVAAAGGVRVGCVGLGVEGGRDVLVVDDVVVVEARAMCAVVGFGALGFGLLFADDVVFIEADALSAVLGCGTLGFGAWVGFAVEVEMRVVFFARGVDDGTFWWGGRVVLGKGQ